MQSQIYNRAVPAPAPPSGFAPQRPGAAIGYAPTPMPRRQDPSQLTPDVAPQDLVLTPYDQSQKEKKILEDFNKDFKEDSDAQRFHHAEWFTAWTMYAGKQWRAWSRSQNRFLSTHPGPGELGYDSSRRYREYNKIKPLVKIAKAKILMNEPGATISPATVNDQNAAREFRSIVSHLQRINDVESLSDELTDWCLQVAPPMLKVYWDPTMTAAIPIIGPDGQIIETREVENAGDIRWELTSPFEWIGDGKAKRFENMRRMWHAQTVPLSYVQERYKNGYQVKPDAFSGDDSGVDSRMSMITGDAPRNGSLTSPNAVLLKEKWEKCSPAYPHGRYILVANEVILAYAEKWPSGGGKVFPFMPYYYEKCIDTVYGANAITPMVHSQILFNKCAAKMEEWMDLSQYLMMIPKGAQVGADAGTRNVDRLMVKEYYRPGFKPDFQVTPPMSPDIVTCMEMAEAFMRDSIGVHEQSNGQTTAGVDTGVAIQLLQQSDDTHLGPVRKLIANFWQGVYEITLGIAKENYLEPRLLMMQDSVQSDPEGAKAEVVTFQHLSTGRIVIAPGSTTPANPTLQAARVMDMMKSGMLRPENIETAIPFLQLLLTENSEKVIDDVLTVAEKIAADKPTPQQMLAQQVAAETAQLHVQTQGKIELAQAVEQLKTQRDGELAAVKLHADQAMAQMQGQIDMLLAQQAQNANLQLAQTKGAMEAERDANAQTQIRLQGDLTPIEVASKAKKLGMDTDDPATLKALGKVDLQSKPSPASGGASKSNQRPRRR